METKICGECSLEKNISDFEYRNDTQKYRGQCKDCVSKRRAKYYVKNGTDIRQKVMTYYFEHQEERDRANKECAKNNWETVKGHKRKWAHNNLDKSREAGARRRGHLSNAIIEVFTTEDVITKYGNQCFYCLEGKFEHLDHYIPISKGGPHTLENVRPACAFCNRSKHDKMPSEFMDK